MELPFQTPNHPRVGVCWYEAAAFCAWLAEQLKCDIRLPHEAEWEQAGRWNGEEADSRYFPWKGSQKDDVDFAQHCNCSQTGLDHTSAVGLFPSGKADCGALDLAGNLWEWCENWYDDSKKYRVLRVALARAGTRAVKCCHVACGLCPSPSALGILAAGRRLPSGSVGGQGP